MLVNQEHQISWNPQSLVLVGGRVLMDERAPYPSSWIGNSELSGVARRRKAPTPEHVEAMSDNSLERSCGNRRSSYGENMFRILAV